jgi:hypothetical protein
MDHIPAGRLFFCPPKSPVETIFDEDEEADADEGFEDFVLIDDPKHRLSQNDSIRQL